MAVTVLVTTDCGQSLQFLFVRFEFVATVTSPFSWGANGFAIELGLWLELVLWTELLPSGMTALVLSTTAALVLVLELVLSVTTALVVPMAVMLSVVLVLWMTVLVVSMALVGTTATALVVSVELVVSTATALVVPMVLVLSVATALVVSVVLVLSMVLGLPTTNTLGVSTRTTLANSCATTEVQRPATRSQAGHLARGPVGPFIVAQLELASSDVLRPPLFLAISLVVVPDRENQTGTGYRPTRPNERAGAKFGNSLPPGTSG